MFVSLQRVAHTFTTPARISAIAPGSGARSPDQRQRAQPFPFACAVTSGEHHKQAGASTSGFASEATRQSWHEGEESPRSQREPCGHLWGASVGHAPSKALPTMATARPQDRQADFAFIA